MTRPYTVGNLLVSDSFNRSNGALGSTDASGALGSLAWQVDGGASLSSYAISSNRAATVGTLPNQPVWVDVGTPNMRVEITVPVLPTGGGNIGVVFRYADRGTSQGGIWFGTDWDSGQLLYAQYHPQVSDAGAVNVIAAGGSCAAGDTITIDAFVDHIWIAKNGAPLHGDTGISSPYLTTATKAGLWQNNNGGLGALDNFKVWKLLPAEKCSIFEGLITDVSNSTNVQLSVASNAFPDALSNYRISFYDNTTGNTTPSTSLLSAGPWTIGPMTAGQHIRYAITRTDGAHINGSCVMRATDTAFGLTWDLTVQCTPFARQALVF